MQTPPPTVREESRRSNKISPPQISTVTGSKCDTVTSSDLPVWVLIVKNVDRKHEVGTLTFSCFFLFCFFFYKVDELSKTTTTQISHQRSRHGSTTAAQLEDKYFLPVWDDDGTRENSEHSNATVDFFSGCHGDTDAVVSCRLPESDLLRSASVSVCFCLLVFVALSISSFRRYPLQSFY